MKKRLIFIGVIAATAVVSAAYYHFSNSRDQGNMILSGNVEVTEVNVAFKVPGRVKALHTDEGRSVRTGERIAELDGAEFETIVHQSSANVRNAEARREKAKNDFERFAKLYKDEAVSPQQMDAARTAFEEADSQLQLYHAALRTAQVRLGDSVIQAPLNGIVLRKNVEQGETVGAGTPIFTIGDLENPWVKVYVKEDKLGLVKLGQKADISVDTFPGKQYEGVVTYIASDAEFTPKNVQTREERVKLVFGVKVSVKNQNNELKPGMPADVRIRVGSPEPEVRSTGQK
ncbi:MAG TPA: efflux RND transporter periplasmic adaptor subunit [Nitrospirota bacterium]|nr:efflux RND transporter periplasmic adaptor subunit [Nitrospirota bacterium]